MSTQKAIVVIRKGHAELVSRPLPQLRDGFILVKTVAVALNPTDWKHIHYFDNLHDVLVGSDYAGIVEAVGKGVTKNLRKGDRVFGPMRGCDVTQKENGAFAEYIVAKGDLANKIPDNLSFEDAATLGMGLITVAQGMYQALGLARPERPITQSEPVLIYGGSTATGSLGIQFAKLSGYTPITVCSPQNFDFVRSRGAVAAFDYHDPDCGRKIREYTHDRLQLVWDTVSLPSSAAICAEALSSSGGGKYYTLLPEKSPRRDVESRMTVAYFMFGEPLLWNPAVGVEQASQEDFRYAAEFLDMATRLVAEGKVKPHPAQVHEGGLGGVLEGLQLMRMGRVSRAKLVYKVSE
ncbi:hypothetical protein VTN96DRAFT_1412 [Rasamsonia emersonii]